MQCSYLVGLDVLYFAWIIIYVLSVCLLATNALTRLRRCASSSERSLFTHAIYELAHFISQYQPAVYGWLFNELLQTVKLHMKFCIMWHFIRIYTVCSAALWCKKIKPKIRIILDFLHSKLKDIKLFQRNVTYYKATSDRGRIGVHTKVLWYFNAYVSTSHFLGFKILNFNIFWWFVEKWIFLGYQDCVDIFWGHHKIGLYLGVISVVFS